MSKKLKRAKADAEAGDADKPNGAAVDATIVVGTYEGALLGVRASDGRQLFGFTAHTGCVKTVSTDAKGRLASGATDHAVRLFDLAKGIETGEIREHDDTVSCVEHWGTTSMLSASEDGHVCIWSCSSWDMLKKFRAHRSAITSIAVHHSGRLMASAAKDKTLRLWDLTRATSAANLSTDDAVEVLNWSPSGDLLAALTPKELLVITAGSGSVAKFKDPGSSGFTRVSLCAVVMLRDDVVVLGDGAGALRVLSNAKDAAGLTARCSLPRAGEAGPRGRVKALARPTSSGGHGTAGVFLAGMSSGRVEVWRYTGDEVSAEAFELLCGVETGVRLTALGAWGGLLGQASSLAGGADDTDAGAQEAPGKKRKRTRAKAKAVP